MYIQYQSKVWTHLLKILSLFFYNFLHCRIVKTSKPWNNTWNHVVTKKVLNKSKYILYLRFSKVATLCLNDSVGVCSLFIVEISIRTKSLSKSITHLLMQLQTEVDNRNKARMFPSKFCKIEKGPSCFLIPTAIYLSDVTAYIITFYSWDQNHAYTAI
jgi:hypothetical protein